MRRIRYIWPLNFCDRNQKFGMQTIDDACSLVSNRHHTQVEGELSNVLPLANRMPKYHLARGQND